jgi:hypothetical protein
VIVSTKKTNPDYCPYCMLPFEIEAVRFDFFEPCSAVFVCRNCGLSRTDNNRKPSITRRILAYVTRRLAEPGKVPNDHWLYPKSNNKSSGRNMIVG